VRESSEICCLRICATELSYISDAGSHVALELSLKRQAFLIDEGAPLGVSLAIFHRPLLSAGLWRGLTLSAKGEARDSPLQALRSATAIALRSEARESIIRDPLPGCGGGDEETRAGTDARVSVEGSHADPKRIAKPGLAA